jgi:hypothetical protein
LVQVLFRDVMQEKQVTRTVLEAGVKVAQDLVVGGHRVDQFQNLVGQQVQIRAGASQSAPA